MIEHDNAPQRRRKRGDQQPVITAAHAAGNRPRGIAAQSIGQEPFLAPGTSTSFSVCFGWLYLSNDWFHVSPLSLAQEQGQWPRAPEFANCPRFRSALSHCRHNADPRWTIERAMLFPQEAPAKVPAPGPSG